MMLPPRWWQFWYPRRWRASHDVWDRLPPAIRRYRAISLGAWVMMSMSAVASIYSMGIRVARPLDAMASTISQVSAGWAFLAIVALLFPIRRLNSWGRLRGLTDLEAQRFGLSPTSKLDIWRKPKYAALLLPASVEQGARVGGAEPQSPGEFIRAIADTSSMLSGPARELGSEALTAARQAADALLKLDAEIALLARDANPGEIASLDQKLAALGEPVTDGPSRHELRQMLTSQSDLLKRLATQLAVAVRDRERVLDLLRTLWLQVANLRAEMARDERSGNDITGRIRSVVAEIEGYSAAAASLDLTLPS